MNARQANFVFAWLPKRLVDEEIWVWWRPGVPLSIEDARRLVAR